MAKFGSKPIGLVEAKLDRKTALQGFADAPWTLATYWRGAAPVETVASLAHR